MTFDRCGTFGFIMNGRIFKCDALKEVPIGEMSAAKKK